MTSPLMKPCNLTDQQHWNCLYRISYWKKHRLSLIRATAIQQSFILHQFFWDLLSLLASC